MTTFQPLPDAILDVDFDPAAPPERLRVVAHPAAPQFAHAAEGSEGTVFQVERLGSGARYALKVFKSTRLSSALPETSRRLRPFASLPGLRACERFCLDTSTSPRVTAALPALRFAVLMPWISDPPWLQTITTGTAITPAFGLEAARSLAHCLNGLEGFGASHGDLSGGNVLVNPATAEVSLVDIESLHAPGLPPPAYTVMGTPGYNLVHTADGVWGPHADRFAAAVLLGELLAWHDPRVRAAASAHGSYFAPEDVASPAAPRFLLLRDVLAARSPRIASLFGNAWISAQRSASPPARAWLEALDGLRGPTRLQTVPLRPDVPGHAAPQPVPYARTQELPGQQGHVDARPSPRPPPHPTTVTLAQPPVVPAIHPIPSLPPLPNDGATGSPVAFWRPLNPAPRSDDPVVGWSTTGPLTPKRYRAP